MHNILFLMMSREDFVMDNTENEVMPLEPYTFRQHSMSDMEEEKLTRVPIVRNMSHNANEKSTADRFIP